MPKCATKKPKCCQPGDISSESLEDCLGSHVVRPITTCWKMVRSSPPESPDFTDDDDDDVSLRSCNSVQTYKQWTMRAPVTTCCTRCPGGRKNRRHSDSDSDSTDFEEVVYVDCNGEAKCCWRPVCRPRKPCTTSKKRLERQSDNTRNCLMSDSDSDSSERTYKEILSQTQVDVDDNEPTKVDLKSCDSSYSDCSLPCHELLTYSDMCAPLAEGLVKMSVRPPEDVEPCMVCDPCGPCQCCIPCTDRDRYDIKFVSHIIDSNLHAKICTIPPVFEPPPPPLLPLPRSVPIPYLPSPHKIPSIHSISPLPTPSPSPPPSIPPPPPIPPPPIPVIPTISEETITPPIIIREPPPILEEIPPTPPPPPPPVISPPPPIVVPGMIGVSGTQVVTRRRCHYGDLCKLIRSSEPHYRPIYPTSYDNPFPYENGNQSNSCATCPPRCESCYPCGLYSDDDLMCDPYSPPCEPCQPPCCTPQPCCRPCCKVTWVRSVSTREVSFTQPLMMRKIEEDCPKPECSEDESDSESSSDEAAADMIRSSVSFAVDDSVHSWAAESALQSELPQLSISGPVSESIQSLQNANINALAPSRSSDPNVGSIHKKNSMMNSLTKKCSEKERRKIMSDYFTPSNQTEYNAPSHTEYNTPSKKKKSNKKLKCNRGKPPNPWKRPADMEQQTFERYVQEIVNKLGPAIPPNPFAVQRQPRPCTAEPDCERILSELETLLALIDECPSACPCPCEHPTRQMC